TAFAAQAAIALENARLYREAEARADKLKALSALTRLMTSAEGASEVCQAVARAATTLLGAASTRVSVADPVARVLRTEGGFSFDPEVEQIVTEVPVIPYGEGLTGRIAESRTPDYILDISNDPQLRNRRLSTVAGLRGFAGLPLVADEQTVGVLAIFFCETRYFTPEERELIALLADQAAIAIRNARMREAVQTHQNHLETLLEVSRQLSKIQPVESLLTTISEACGRLLNSESVGFRRVEGEELVLAGSWGDAKEVLITPRLKFGESLAGRVAVGGEPLLVADLANDLRVTATHRESCSRRGYRAMLAVPVKVGERVVGVLAFSRKQVLNPAVLDLNAVVSKMGEMLRRLIGEDIALVTGLGSSLGHVKADPGQIEQIIMNLAVNARDAMPEGGRLTLETANIELDVAYARKHVGARPGPHVMLALSDTGTGMDAQTQARIFEPFFTTKGPRKGTGLGLAMVYGIVKQSGGNIWVYSEPGQGTTFKIYLSQIEDPLDGAHESSTLAAPCRGRGTVLVVEDEDGVRNLVRDILQTAGYTVLEARHGAEALHVSERHVGPIHLMLTDVVMPEMSGRELAQRLAVLRPATKVLFMSGYTANAVVH